MNEYAAGIQNARNLLQHVAPARDEMEDMYAEDGIEARASEGKLRGAGAHDVDGETAALGEKALHHAPGEVHARDTQAPCRERQGEASCADADFEETGAGLELRRFRDECRNPFRDAGRESTRRIIDIGRPVEDDRLVTGSLSASLVSRLVRRSALAVRLRVPARFLLDGWFVLILPAPRETRILDHPAPPLS